MTLAGALHGTIRVAPSLARLKISWRDATAATLRAFDFEGTIPRGRGATVPLCEPNPTAGPWFKLLLHAPVSDDQYTTGVTFIVPRHTTAAALMRSHRSCGRGSSGSCMPCNLVIRLQLALPRLSATTAPPS